MFLDILDDLVLELPTGHHLLENLVLSVHDDLVLHGVPDHRLVCPNGTYDGFLRVPLSFVIVITLFFLRSSLTSYMEVLRCYRNCSILFPTVRSVSFRREIKNQTLTSIFDLNSLGYPLVKTRVKVWLFCF